MDRKVFWSTKSPLAEYHAVTLSHPVFEAPFRLVANQFAEVTLGGYVYTPAAMSIKPPEQKSDAQSKLTLVFPRQVVGRTFKQQLKLIKDSGSRAPISVTYDVYLGDTTAPKLSWSLYAADDGGVKFATDGVQVTASDNNPMRLSAATIYDPAVYTGLEILR